MEKHQSAAVGGSSKGGASLFKSSVTPPQVEHPCSGAVYPWGGASMFIHVPTDGASMLKCSVPPGWSLHVQEQCTPRWGIQAVHPQGCMGDDGQRRLGLSAAWMCLCNHSVAIRSPLCASPHNNRSITFITTVVLPLKMQKHHTGYNSRIKRLKHSYL